MTEKVILILGGDKRLDTVYDILSENNKSCIRITENQDNLSDVINQSSYILLPVPTCDNNGNIFSKNNSLNLNCQSIADMINKKHIVFGCNFSKNLKYLLDKKNVIYYDLNCNEDFLVYNAYLTAQAALRLLLENTDEYIIHKKILITGFGRVGRALAQTLKSLTPDITVCARNKAQLNEAECSGLKITDYSKLTEHIKDKDYILNTVPDRVFTAEQISLLSESAVYFELASNPFGADRNDFERLNKRYIYAGGLPGKYLPFSAGKKIAEIIERFI